jgi:hypothetical protein
LKLTRTPSTLGSELVHICVGEEKVHHRLHQKFFKERLPRFLDLYLKDETTNRVTLPDLEPDVFGLLIKWLFLAGNELEYEATFDLLELYGFAEALGENALMNDVMTAMYAIYYRYADVISPLYIHSYRHTKPGSKLRDFLVHLFAWELVNLEREQLHSMVGDGGEPELGSNGWELYMETAERIDDLRNDLWSVLSKLSLERLPPYRQGVCEFHVHSEEAKEWCPGAARFPKEDPYEFSRGGLAGTYAISSRSSTGTRASTSYDGSRRGSAGSDRGSTGTRASTSYVGSHQGSVAGTGYANSSRGSAGTSPRGRSANGNRTPRIVSPFNYEEWSLSSKQYSNRRELSIPPFARGRSHSRSPNRHTWTSSCVHR